MRFISLLVFAPSIALAQYHPTHDVSGGGGGMAATLIDTSAELLGILGDETGTGAACFADSPTFADDITIGAAGVKLTGATGKLTTLALSGTAENLTCDLSASNVATFSSSTGVATANFSSMTLQESGNGVINSTEIDTSAELLALLTDETGTGAACFATAPTFTTSVQIGSAGVLLSDDGDGALTMLSKGDGSGGLEDLTFNFDDTADIVTVTSGTGVTAVNFSSVAPQSSGSNLLTTTAIDTSSELATILTDETGSGAACFATAPTFTTSVQFGTAGVLVSDDGDGALTFLSKGNGSGGLENLTFNFEDTTNVVNITSSTGVTAIRSSSAALQGTGTVAIPDLGFANDPDTGLYSAAANTIGFTATGSQLGAWSSSALYSTTSATLGIDLDNEWISYFGSGSINTSSATLGLDNQSGSSSISNLNWTSIASALTSQTLNALADGGETIDNNGASARADYTLPASGAGIHYYITVLDTDGIKIIANTGDTVYLNSVNSASAGYICSVVIGSYVDIWQASNNATWLSIAKGTWTQDAGCP